MEEETSKSPKTDAETSQEKSSTNTPASQAQNPRRRRGHGLVTPHACTECRRKRAKCDGQHPCSRCKSQGDVECVYETPLRQSKDELRSELEQLRRREGSASRVIAALGRPELSNDILTRLWCGQTVETISEWIDETKPGERLSRLWPMEGQLMDMQTESNNFFMTDPQLQMSNEYVRGVPNLIDVSGGPNVLPHHSQQGVHAFRERNSVLWPLGEPPTEVTSSWTTVTRDRDLVQHLLALYFCWEYPTFASLSREHYLRDFHHGRERYCSALLTNALLALGCRFSSRPTVCADPSDPSTSGEHFFKECLRIYYGERDHHNLTTVQALGIMAIREASCGRVSASEFYAGQCMRLALEMGLHTSHMLDPQSEEELDDRVVRLATFWGAFALDNALSFAGSLPKSSSIPSLPPKPPTISALERHPWIPYTDDDMPLHLPYQQASNERSVFELFCQLSELAHQSIYLLHNPGRPLTAQALLQFYTRYLVWYDQLPEALRLGQNFTPYVLFAHMYYHFAIVLLFWPLCGCGIIGTELSPRNICVEAADAISTLLKSYARLYTLHRTPSLVPYLALTAAIVHLATITDYGRVSPATPRRVKHPSAHNAAFESLKGDVAALKDMSRCHLFAGKALGILSYLFKRWEVDIEVEAGEVSLQDCIDICWPYNRTFQGGPPLGLSEDISEREMEERGSIRTTRTTLESIQHPLFFPLREMRRQTALTDEALRRAGFSHLG